MGNVAKELMYAFMGKEIEKEEEKINVHSLRSMTEELLKLNENDWVLYAFSREPLERKISLEDKFQFAYLARVCGENEANNIAGNDFTRCAENMGFTVRTPHMPNGGANVTFAQYEESGEITIFMDTVKKAEPVLYELKDLLGEVDIYSVLLLHEMFHGIEQIKADTIYTKTKKIQLWRKPFSNLSRISCLSEIAAMSFARSVLDLSYSPYIFDVILMYLYNREAASMLFDEIMEIKEAA